MLKELQQLIRDRDACNQRLEDYESEIANIQHELRGPREVKGIDYSRERVQSTNHLAFGDAIRRLGEINSHILLHKEQLEQFNELINTIATTLELFDRVEYNVFIMHCVKGMKFADIAETLDYSERQIYRYWDRVKL